ncbi:unnamed protein product [Haemonchus placei]|uniref:TonB-dependent receptor n=1 Tax=Haemonchus placei TaxID=6290 RepID=A0A0N4XB06_HAEPC|nr:unnamed protein product [Haemonchus placei]
MQRPAPPSYHLGDKPRAVPSVYAADLELVSGAANTRTSMQTGFRNNLPHTEQFENLVLNEAGDAPRPVYSTYANLSLSYNSTTDTLWENEMAHKYSFLVPSNTLAPFGKGADMLTPTTKGSIVKQNQISAYVSPCILLSVPLGHLSIIIQEVVPAIYKYRTWK